MNWNAKQTQPIAMPTSWAELPQGKSYCKLLSQYFSPWSERVLGHQIVKLGQLSGEVELNLPLRHQITLSEKTFPNDIAFAKNNSLVQAKLTALPFIQKEINAILLAQTLNFSQDPHQVLREVRRVLTDDGYLFLSLFNLISPLLFKHKLGNYRFRQYPTWRVLDWLALLNFEILAQQDLSLSAKSRWSPPVLTVIVAKKQRYPLTLNTSKERLNFGNFLTPAEAFKEIKADKKISA